MWLFFTLATTLLWGAAELFYKKGSHEDRKYDHLRVCILVGAVMGLHAVVTLLTSDVSYDPRNLIAYLPVSLCYILSMACSFFGIRFIEESLADPIENTAGAMCSLLCVIFLNEKIAPAIWVAIGIIVIGIVGMFMAIINYPIYKGILGSRRKKYADKIIALSDKIMEA